MMTNKEVIFWLNQIKDRYIRGGDEQFDANRKEAIDLAVKILETPQDDLISRSYLKQMIPTPIEDEYKYVHQIIDNAPAVDISGSEYFPYRTAYFNGVKDGKATARPQGEWIFGSTLGHGWMKCSNCCVSQSGQTLCWSYCPNCGAEMKGCAV